MTETANPSLPLHRRWLLLALVVFATLANYAASSDLLLYADDYIAWSKVLTTLDSPWWSLFGHNYNPEFYRPFEHLLIRLNVVVMGTNPVLYRWATIIGHLLMVLGVYWFARRLRFGSNTSLSAALIFGLSHANAMAVLSNDAACQIYSTLFGTLSLGLMLRQDDKPLPIKLAWPAALLLLGSLLWKDAGISYAPALAYLIFHELRRVDQGERIKRLIGLGLPFALVLALYFALRLNAGVTGPGFGQVGRYDLWFGANVPVNVFLFLLGMLSPVGSSIVVLRLLDISFVVLWTGALAAMLVVFFWGAVIRWRRGAGEHRRLIVAGILMLAVSMPDIFMNKISELYVYKPNVLFAVLLAASLTVLYAELLVKKKRTTLFLLIIFCIALVFSHSFSVQHKAQRMRTNGLLAQRLTQEIRAQMPELAGRKILAVNRVPGPAPLYSIYYMEGVYVLGGGKVFEYLYGKKLEEFQYYSFEDLDRGLREIEGRKIIVLFRRDHIHLAVVDGEQNPFRSMPP